MEQRAYTRINKALDEEGAIKAEKIREVAELVSTQVRLAQELGAEVIRSVATAAVREASNGELAAEAIAEASGVGGRHSQRGGGGSTLLHRRHQDARPSGGGQDGRRRCRRRLDRGDPRHGRPAGSRWSAPGGSDPESSPMS